MRKVLRERVEERKGSGRMLVEKSLKEALKYFINGKPVTVLYISEDGGMDARKLEDTLNQKVVMHLHYAVVLVKLHPQHRRQLQV